MKRRTSEAATWKNFDKFEKQVWQLECRQTKALAGGLAGRIIGDIVFIFILLGVTYCWMEGIDQAVVSAGLPRMRLLGLQWQTLQNACLPGFRALERDSCFFASILVAILAAAAANLLTNAAVRLFWPRAKFVPVEGSALAQSEVLCQRRSAADQMPPSRKWYFNFVPVVIYIAAFAFDAVSTEVAESGQLAFAFTVDGTNLIALCASLALIFIIPYFLYRGLSGFLIRRFYWISRKVHRVTALGTALQSYVTECKKLEELGEKMEQRRKQAEEDRKRAEQEERSRLQGDALYRQAIASKPLDEALIAEAAELGCRPACLYIGRRLMDEWYHGVHTEEEERELAELAQGYFLTASQEREPLESQVEAEFGYLLFTAVLLNEGRNRTAGSTLSQWQEIHNRLKAIRASGKLDKKYEAQCVRVIDVVAHNVEDAQENKDREEGRIVVLSDPSHYFPSDPAPYDARDDDYLDDVARAMERTEKFGMDWKGWDPEAPTDIRDIW